MERRLQSSAEIYIRIQKTPSYYAKKNYSGMMKVISNKKIIVVKKDGDDSKEFTFDGIFPEGSSMESLFNEGPGLKLVEHVESGYSCTLMSMGVSYVDNLLPIIGHDSG